MQQLPIDLLDFPGEVIAYNALPSRFRIDGAYRVLALCTDQPSVEAAQTDGIDAKPLQAHDNIRVHLAHCRHREHVERFGVRVSADIARWRLDGPRRDAHPDGKCVRSGARSVNHHDLLPGRDYGGHIPPDRLEINACAASYLDNYHFLSILS